MQAINQMTESVTNPEQTFTFANFLRGPQDILNNIYLGPPRHLFQVVSGLDNVGRELFSQFRRAEFEKTGMCVRDMVDIVNEHWLIQSCRCVFERSQEKLAVYESRRRHFESTGIHGAYRQARQHADGNGGLAG